ncbi:MAG: glycoside hydrolase family 16 protein [Eubacterium sp.]|nr:glycoside hydrolase family 16 protein [Eubacterium sp.]
MKKVLSIILSFALLIAPIGASCVSVNADGTFNAVIGTTWNQTSVNTSGDAQGVWQYKLLQNEWKSMAGTYSGASGVQGFTFTTAKYGWDGFHLKTNDIKGVCGLQAYHVYDATFRVTHTGANATNIHFLTSGGLGSYNISKQSTTINSASSPVTFSGQICVDDESELTLTIDMGVNATGGSSGCQAGTLQITQATFTDTGVVVDKTFSAKIYDDAAHEAAGDDGWDKTDVEEVDDQQGVWGYKYLEWYDGGNPMHRLGSYSGASSAERFVFNTTYGWDGFSFRLDLTKALNIQAGYFYDLSVTFKYTFTGNESDKTFYVDCHTSGGLGNYAIPSERRAISPSTNTLTSEGRVCSHGDSDLYLEFNFSRGTIGCPAGKFEITSITAVKDTEWTPVKNNNSAEGVGPWGLFALFDAAHPTYGHWGALSYKTIGTGEDFSDTTILVRSKSGWLGAEASWARIRDYASNRLEVGTHTQGTIVINSTKATAEDSYIRVGIGDHSELFTLQEGDNELVTEEFTYNDQYSMDISFELDMIDVGTELKVKSIDLLNGVEPEDDPDVDPVDPVLSPDTMHVEDDGATWSDEFNGTELDEDKWVIQEGNRSGSDGPINWGNNEKENYQEDNVSVGNGVLKIEAREEKTTIGTGEDALEYDYTSGRINTRGKFSAGFGYVEASLKFDVEKGLWPAFWMLGEKKATWPRNGEIDILEQANTNDYFQSTVHFYNSTWGSNDEHHTSKNDEEAHAKMSGIDFSQYHKYGVNRNGDTIAFYLDREKVYEYIIENDKKKSPSRYPSAMNNDYYLLLNLAVGGNFTHNQLPENLPKSMQVDYVRYYEADGLNRIQPDVWTTVGAWDLYNGKDDWCDYARMNYEQSEGSDIGDTKMILTESPRSDDNDKEYGLGARLNNHSSDKMINDRTYKAKITLNSSRAGTLITNVEGTEYRIDIDEGENVVYTDEFVYDEFNSYSTTPSHNPRDVYFYLGMMPKNTEITISEVEFEEQLREWTPVPNFNPDSGGQATYHSAGQLQLLAMYGPNTGYYGKMEYKVENEGEELSDTTVKVTSTTTWDGDERPYSTNIRLKNYNDDLAIKENYSGVIKVESNKATAIGKKLHIVVDNSIIVEEPLVIGENTINIPEFTYSGENSNIDFDLDELTVGTEIKITSAEFTPIEPGWNAVPNNEDTTVGPWTLSAAFMPESERWGALSYKDISDVNDGDEIGDTLIKVRSASGYDGAWDTYLTLSDYLSDRNLKNNTRYRVVVTYYASKASRSSKYVLLWANNKQFNFELQKCNDLSTYKRVQLGYLRYDSSQTNDIKIQLDNVNEGTSFSIKYIEFIEDSTSKPYYDVTPYKNSSSYPKQDGQLFAGWFEDEEFTEPHMEETGKAYAKFVDEKMLTVKCQWKLDSSAIRFVSSIDVLDYQSAGFEFEGQYGDKTISNREKDVDKVYRVIKAGDDSITPNKVFADESEYFFTYTIRNMDENTDSSWTVTPFYVTGDGTKVYGTTNQFAK